VRSRGLGAGFALLLLAGCSPHAEAGAVARIETPHGVVRVHVQIADDAAERTHGLADRRSLARDAGMAFLFAHPVRASFWMKDTTIPLSIAFWDSSGRIVAILDMPPCRANPCPTYRPDRPFLGALEVNRGYFREAGVGEGDRVAIER
jgi:uncharacterized membrane protein (UPF0127 family)